MTNSRLAYTPHRGPGPVPPHPDTEPTGAVDLRSIWPNLSGEQRDALVGGALGYEAETSWGIRIKESQIFSLWKETREGAIDFLDRHPDLTATHEVASHQFWSPYSSTQDGFDQIFKECIRRQWPASLVYRGVAQGTVYATVKGCNSDEVATAPEALALAFCLATGVEVPPEWTKEGA